MTFKYNLDQVVYSKWDEEYCVILQKRNDNGNPTYRLDNGAIRHESQLYPAKKKEETKPVTI